MGLASKGRDERGKGKERGGTKRGREEEMEGEEAPQFTFLATPLCASDWLQWLVTQNILRH